MGDIGSLVVFLVKLNCEEGIEDVVDCSLLWICFSGNQDMVICK